jgi:hypothetical protein
MTTRVQIPAYTDRWMMGDRYGVIVKTTRRAVPVNGEANKFVLREIAHVKLDKSGKTGKFILDDCTVV